LKFVGLSKTRFKHTISIISENSLRINCARFHRQN
jgi:hypothetical protein